MSRPVDPEHWKACRREREASEEREKVERQVLGPNDWRIADTSDVFFRCKPCGCLIRIGEKIRVRGKRLQHVECPADDEG